MREPNCLVATCGPSQTAPSPAQIFEKHGTVDEIFIMRGGSRSGMACAFVRFATQETAQRAIDAIHGNVTLPDASEPLVVRWADAPGSRGRESRGRQPNERRRSGGDRRSGGGGGGGGGGGMAGRYGMGGYAMQHGGYTYGPTAQYMSMHNQMQYGAAYGQMYGQMGTSGYHAGDTGPPSPPARPPAAAPCRAPACPPASLSPSCASPRAAGYPQHAQMSYGYGYSQHGMGMPQGQGTPHEQQQAQQAQQLQFMYAQQQYAQQAAMAQGAGVVPSHMQQHGYPPQQQSPGPGPQQGQPMGSPP